MPDRNRNNGKAWLAALAVVLLLGAGWLWLSGAFAPWSFTKSVSVEPQGYFFRVKASYTHGGEPIEFDYVAVCGYRTTRYKDGDKSVDGTYAPKVMIKATSDGGALQIRTPRACHGQTTANGKAPDDLLPFIIWFDDVEDLTFGWGYASPDAYDSPHAQVRFHGATIEAATAEDWKAWRAKAEAEYEPKGMLPGPWGWSDSGGRDYDGSDFRNRIARGCRGYIRLKLPEEVRQQVRDYWPADRPRYWEPSAGEVVPLMSWKSPDGTVHDAIYESGGNRGVIHKFVSGAIYGEKVGVPTRAGGGTIDLVRKHYPADTFPVLPRSRSVASPPTQPADSYPRRVIVRDDMKGFVACVGRSAVDSALPSFDQDFRSKKHPIYVNDDVAFEDYNPLTLPARFFEKDEFYFGKTPWR